MKIQGLRPVLLSHDYGSASTQAWVGGRIETWDAALVEITTDDGVRGVGEVAQGIMGAVAVPGLLDALRPHAEGLPIDEPWTVGDALRSATAFWARGGIASGVVAAVEAAAFDAAALARGVPAYLLMGDRRARSIEVYASGGLGTTLAQVTDWALRMQDAGYRTVKFRAMGDPDRTSALLDAVVPRLAPGTQFVLDAVQGCARRPWPLAEAVRVGHRAADLGARWYEEPCRAEDVAGYAQVRAAVPVPVSGVESYSTRQEFDRLFEHGGVDIAQPDAAMLGGPIEQRRVVEAARSRDVAVVPHVWGTGVTLMTNLHLALATDGMDLVEWCTVDNPLREALLVAPLTPVQGRVPAPEVPGLGVALTEEIERQFPFQPGRGHVIR